MLSYRPHDRLSDSQLVRLWSSQLRQIPNGQAFYMRCVHLLLPLPVKAHIHPATEPSDAQF
jgi:hypothetical protein